MLASSDALIDCPARRLTLFVGCLQFTIGISLAVARSSMCGLTSFTRRTLVRQWVFGITLGHEDLSDHDDLRSPAVACRDLAAGQDDPTFAGAVATPETTIAIPWTVPAAAPVNGIAHDYELKPDRA